MVIFTILSILSVLLSFYFFWRQNNRAKMGGTISKAKAFWLFFTIYVWFFLLPYCYYNFELRPYTDIWIIFSLWMWIRGIVEIFMMFVTKNWVPPIGIIHDLSCVIIFLGLSIYWFSGLKAHFNWPYGIFHLTLISSIILETYYAHGFYKIVGTKTKGDEAVWYAPADDASFQSIVKVTGICNLFLFSSLFFFLGKVIYRM